MLNVAFFSLHVIKCRIHAIYNIRKVFPSILQNAGYMPKFATLHVYLLIAFAVQGQEKLSLPTHTQHTRIQAVYIEHPPFAPTQVFLTHPHISSIYSVSHMVAMETRCGVRMCYYNNKTVPRVSHLSIEHPVYFNLTFTSTLFYTISVLKYYKESYDSAHASQKNAVRQTQ